MRRIAISAITAFVVCIGNAALAAPDPAKCIIEAAARIPVAPGLTVTESKHRELTAKEAVAWKNHPYGPPLVVEVTARAAGQEAGYAFLCLSTGVRPLPDGKVP